MSHLMHCIVIVCWKGHVIIDLKHEVTGLIHKQLSRLPCKQAVNNQASEWIKDLFYVFFSVYSLVKI